MGLLDNSTLTVDAVLTKKGREKLSQNVFNVTNFAICDDEIDYTLWNTSHPSGSLFYGATIENLPIMEANVYTQLVYKIKKTQSTFNIQQKITAGGAESNTNLPITYNRGGQTIEGRFKLYQVELNSTDDLDNFVAKLIIAEIPGEVDDLLRQNVYVINYPDVQAIVGSSTLPPSNVVGALPNAFAANTKNYLRNYVTTPAGRSSQFVRSVDKAYPYIWIAVFGDDLYAVQGSQTYAASLTELVIEGTHSGVRNVRPVSIQIV